MPILETGGSHGVLLEFPEPIDLARVTFRLLQSATGTAPYSDVGDLWVVPNRDATRVLLFRGTAGFFTSGYYRLDLALLLDLGAERAVWRRGGSTAPEVGALEFEVG